MTKEDYMKLSKERLAELLAKKDAEDEFNRGIYRGYAPSVPTITYQPPCYSKDGICTNPFRDCINCPRQFGGGNYTTTTDVKINEK